MEAILKFGQEFTEIETADEALIKALRRVSLSYFKEIRLKEFDGTYETWEVPAGWCRLTLEPPKADTVEEKKWQIPKPASGKEGV